MIRTMTEQTKQEIIKNLKPFKRAETYAVTLYEGVIRPLMQAGIDRKGETPKKKVKTQGKLILANIEWYNAGLYTGKQGYLRDKFYELFAKLDDFLLVMAEIRKDSKYLAEIKGLDDNKRRAWLIGFFSCINQASNV